ncbi:adhesion G protein-coupled receptor B3-like [Amphiura filiformis]|uniref:adhesion G protein-coupled receptor B3-like n=1 Tax=Amphiura filiformis TaxID=82378 RepID=UPI003B2148D3
MSDFQRRVPHLRGRWYISRLLNWTIILGILLQIYDCTSQHASQTSTINAPTTNQGQQYQGSDVCHPNPCNGGHCTESGNSYVCSCSHGFSGPTCEQKFVHVGCWKKHSGPDKLEPAINTTHDILLDWRYADRPDAIHRCGLTAMSANKGYTVFGVHNGGECWSHDNIWKFLWRDAIDTCSEGKGGEDSFDLYVIQGEQEFVSSWTEWSSWTSCNAGCEGGEEKRRRYCIASKDQLCDDKPWRTKEMQEQGCNWGTCPWNAIRPITGLLSASLGCWKHPTSLSISLEDYGFDVLDPNGRSAYMEKCSVAAYIYYQSNISIMTNKRIYGLQHKECWVAAETDILHYRDNGPTYDCNDEMAVYIFVDQDPGMPIDGQWGPWQPHSSCSKPCDHGLQEEIRQCNNPIPSMGGLECTGPWHQNASCNIEACPETFNYVNIGCWLDGNLPIMYNMEGTSEYLDLPLSKRKNALMKCAYVAFLNQFTVFGIKYGGECYSGPKAECNFDRYGISSSCTKGLGSNDSYDVYSLDVSLPDNIISLSYQVCLTDASHIAHIIDQKQYVENAESLGITQSIAILRGFSDDDDDDDTSQVSAEIFENSQWILLETARKTMVNDARNPAEINEYVHSFVGASSDLLSDMYDDVWSDDNDDSGNILLAMETFSRSLSAVYIAEEGLRTESDNVEFEMLTVGTNEIAADGNLMLPTKVANRNSKEPKASVAIPQDYFEEIESEYGIAGQREVFTSIAIYDNLDRWFSQGIPQRSSNSTTMINSKVVTVVTRPELTKPLSGNPIVLNLKSVYDAKDTDEIYNVTCVYWKYDDRSHSAAGSWSSEGCSMVFSDKDMTECHCTHLTSFAVLVSVNNKEISEANQLALSIITYICTGISLIALSGAFLIFTYLNLLDSDRTTIHKNLIVALGLAQLLFIVGITQTDYKVICTTIAWFLHLLYMAAFCWMLCEGLHLYLKIVQVFSHRKTLPIYYGVGWGIPIVIVGTSLAIRPQGYGTENYCWLTLDDGLIWAFVGPMLAIIAINCMIMILVIRIIVKSASHMPGQDEKDKMKQMRAGVKGIAILTPILGLAWLFGILAINENILFFEYLFNIFNCLQGFFIFIFHCVGSSEVRAALQRKHEQRSLSKHSGGSSGLKTPLSPNNRKTSTATSNTNLSTSFESTGNRKASDTGSLALRVAVLPQLNNDDHIPDTNEEAYELTDENNMNAYSG